MRTLQSVMGNSQRLDGGAMFGNAPKAMWEKWIAPDEQNRIPLACRALLMQDETPSGTKRNVLFETGIGAFFEPAMKARFGVVEEHHVLLESLAAIGLQPADIDVVMFSHLHFDHAGGALTAWQAGTSPQLAFPNARYLVGTEAWDRAKTPHARDRASFIPELTGLLEASGRLELIEGNFSTALGSSVKFHRSHGHTPGLLLAEIAMPDGPVVFAADLIPGRPWVHVPITMGYDRYPELIIEEKTTLLADLESRGGRLFFTHDPSIAMGRVVKDAKGKFSTADDLAVVQAVIA
jgi:glyoxylase-like metal-dependent hydrolase (beta-lactamase superfamily II)